jgi:hypothetical protein
MFTNRSVSTTGNGSNQAYGADAAFSFGQSISTGAYYARTKTPGLEGDSASYQARFEYLADRYGARAEYLKVGDHFNPEVGFLRRADFGRSFASLRFSPRPKKIKAVRKFTWEGSLEYVLNGAGSLETRQLAGRFNTEFETSDQLTVEATSNYELLVRPFAVGGIGGVVIPPGGYDFNNVLLSYSLGQQRRVSGVLSAQTGGYYGGTLTAFAFTGGRVSLTKRLSLEPGFSLNRASLPAGDFTTKLVRARGDYGFSPRMFVSAFVQYSSSDKSLSSNLRFRWEYRPGSELFLVFTDEHDTRPGADRLKNRGFVVKFNKLFRF